ncbi:MAG: hypothetical protein EPO32_01495 [Anaerolineae bacterium]|nr:MAG: hypothetical protein EPO32_01495 [Anaerolineae bacterium]
MSKKTYPANEIDAAKSVLIELTHMLGEYRDSIVLVGGWVPEILLTDSAEPHIGSIDVDLALDHRKISEPGYKSILQLLQENGYEQSGDQPFTFLRTVPQSGANSIVVQVDFLSGEDGGTGRGRRTQRVQELQPRKARGCDLAFEHNVLVSLAGRLPSGARDRVETRVASIPVFITMKGFALKNRLKEKDAWDIYFCLRNYPGGISDLAIEFKLLLEIALVQEALSHIAEAFVALDSIGPIFVADFEGVAGEERELLIRDSYERVNELLRLLSAG